ncbi:hypothetical protein [Tardiphaga sp. vice278]|uniref:hypothetical protein n=1 Tax=Tardiphaga sp. vice278 TaxID=2592815 RepID=UPI001162C7A8|nr:hypothetical protein [Tardiphaga sp. vice278]QDM15474.1 hypothetical protein FNL53_05610 [Tardiphaga sp. vice278]
MRVTFDTNVLDLACRPDRFPKDARQPGLRKVFDALSSGAIEGFYSVTMLTIEGIMNNDRADVFSSTQLAMKPETTEILKASDLPEDVRAFVGNNDIESISMEFRVEQPSRQPLHPEVIARMKAAQELGLLVLKDVPRIGAFKFNDPENKFYLSTGEGEQRHNWIEKVLEVAAAIQARGLGFGQVKALGHALTSGDPAEAWFKALKGAKDVHEERAVQRAFSEWADGDAIAAHVAYGLDVFCSADVGKSNAKDSILDPTNRAWLSATYGVKFMTFEDLLDTLPSAVD